MEPSEPIAWRDNYSQLFYVAILSHDHYAVNYFFSKFSTFLVNEQTNISLLFLPIDNGSALLYDTTLYFYAEKQSAVVAHIYYI